MNKYRKEDVLRRLEIFNSLARKSTDEIGWIALAYSCSREEAMRLIFAARDTD
jgi:hypothetical protein